MPVKLKILVSSYACAPDHGSEPGMGWNFVYEISRCHEVHVITEELKWREGIERKLLENPSLKENLKFYFIYKKRNKFLRKIWPPSYYWYYKKWQKKAFKLALHLDSIENFDIFHQLNMVGFREPGYLWKINKPFVWGPIGGMGITSWRFLPTMGLHGCIHYFFRNLINIFQMYLMIRPKKAAHHKNSIIISATEENSEYIKRIWNRSSILIPEVGLLRQEIKRLEIKSSQFEICWCGQLTPGKSLNLLIDALKVLQKKDDIHLHIIGEGPKSNEWKSKACKLGISNLTWYGWLPHEKTLEIMRRSQLFVITSLSDLTSTVLLEALSIGLPVIAPDHCGFSNIITEKCGFKIPLKSKNQFIRDFAEKIQLVKKNQQLRIDLSKGAMQRAKEFSWEKKGEMINKIYFSLLE